jgi:hypothetical protein
MTWKSLWKVRVGDDTTEAGLRFLEERSPLNRADRIVRPLLIGQARTTYASKPRSPSRSSPRCSNTASP